ncbi:phage tail protein I [Selenomonas dianae]|uniref:Phage tail protein I n=1 Tax=Selenomonas dianae TaxID=135079 RepID=A0ABN0SY50_9FIRM|nr:phage tail protein I [Selenomonas dianae]WLD81406.1 phage tail protein I [Selenomonas dianae]
MSKDLQSVSLLDILPPNLLADKQIYVAARALDDELQKITEATRNALLLPRLDELSEEIIDLLAWQWHVDFYEPSMSIDVKRQLVRESIAWHRIKGTKDAVEKMVQTVFSGGIVTEWFEYGGEPYHFRIDVLNAPNMTAENMGRLLAVVNASKNTRSWLDELRFRREAWNDMYYASAPTIHTTYEIRPAQITDAQTSARHYIGAAASTHTTYEVYPDVARDAKASIVFYAGGVGITHKVLEVTQT